MDNSFSKFNEQNKLTIHEHALTDLIARLNFTQAIYYTWTGRFPSEQEEAMLNACFVALIDHGEDALTAKAARVAVSGGAETHAAIASGLLAAGKHHGTKPLEDATLLFRKAVKAGISAEEIVKKALEEKKRLPGFGHRLYKTDPRTEELLQKAGALGFMDEHVKLAQSIEKELEKQKGKKLCLNVDGMIAALLPGLGIEAELAPGIFVIARSVGLMMHVKEEKGEKPARMRKV